MTLAQIKNSIFLMTTFLSFCAQGAPSCQWTKDTLEQIAYDEHLVDLHQVYVDSFSTVAGYCDFVDKTNQKFEANKALNLSFSELRPYCEAQFDLALHFLHGVNQAYKLFCQANDCVAIEARLKAFPWLVKAGSQYSFVHPQIKTIQSTYANKDMTLSKHSFAGTSLLNRCGDMSISFIQVERYFDVDVEKMNEVLEKDLDDSMLLLKNSTKSPLDFFNDLSQDNYFSFYREQEICSIFSKVLCLETLVYQDTGGAHGYGGKSYVNFDTQTYKKLTLSDLFKLEDKLQLISLLENSLIEWSDRHDDSSPKGAGLQERGFQFSLDYIPEESQDWSNNKGWYLSQNFYFDLKGLHVVYNPYEIGPYAFGIIDITLSWADINDLIVTEYQSVAFL